MAIPNEFRKSLSRNLHSHLLYGRDLSLYWNFFFQLTHETLAAAIVTAPTRTSTARERPRRADRVKLRSASDATSPPSIIGACLHHDHWRLRHTTPPRHHRRRNSHAPAEHPLGDESAPPGEESREPAPARGGGEFQMGAAPSISAESTRPDRATPPVRPREFSPDLTRNAPRNAATPTRPQRRKGCALTWVVAEPLSISRAKKTTARRRCSRPFRRTMPACAHALRRQKLVLPFLLLCNRLSLSSLDLFFFLFSESLDL